MTAEQLTTEQGFASGRKNDKARTHFVFVDVLNIVSCFAVVCLHTSLGVFSPQRTRLWAFQELMQAVFIFCGADFLHGQRYEFTGLSEEIFDESVF